MTKLLVAVVLMLTLSNATLAQDLVEKALEDPYFNWKSIENTKVRVYYKPFSFAERHRSTLLRSVTTAIEEDLNFWENRATTVSSTFFTWNPVKKWNESSAVRFRGTRTGRPALSASFVGSTALTRCVQYGRKGPSICPTRWEPLLIR